MNLLPMYLHVRDCSWERHEKTKKKGACDVLVTFLDSSGVPIISLNGEMDISTNT